MLDMLSVGDICEHSRLRIRRVLSSSTTSQFYDWCACSWPGWWTDNAYGSLSDKLWWR